MKILIKGMSFFVCVCVMNLEYNTHETNAIFVFPLDVSGFQNLKGLSGFRNSDSILIWMKCLLIFIYLERSDIKNSDGVKGVFEFQ